MVLVPAGRGTTGNRKKAGKLQRQNLKKTAELARRRAAWAQQVYTGVVRF